MCVCVGGGGVCVCVWGCACVCVGVHVCVCVCGGGGCVWGCEWCLVINVSLQVKATSVDIQSIGYSIIGASPWPFTSSLLAIDALSGLVNLTGMKRGGGEEGRRGGVWAGHRMRVGAGTTEKRYGIVWTRCHFLESIGGSYLWSCEWLRVM